MLKILNNLYHKQFVLPTTSPKSPKKISSNFIVWFAKTVKKSLIFFKNGVNYPKDNKTIPLQSRVSLSYFILPTIASIAALETGMPADITPSVEMLVDYKLQSMPDVTHNIPHMHSVKDLVEPVIGVCNNIASVVAEKQRILDLVYWPDVQPKVDILSLKNIKMIPQQFSGYSGNIMSPDLYNYGQTTHNGANSFFHNLPHRSCHYHPYIKSVYLIPVIPAFIFSIRALFILSSDIIYTMFVQTYSWFTQIFWGKIKTTSFLYSTSRTRASEGRSLARRAYINRSWNISSANKGSVNNGNNGDGNGDGGPGRSLNFYEEIQGALNGLIKCIKEIIKALKAIQKLIDHILRNIPISSRRMARIIDAIDEAVPAFHTNFWLRGDYILYNSALLTTLSAVALESLIFTIIQGDVTMVSYTAEYGADELQELMNLSPQSIERLRVLWSNISPVIKELSTILVNLTLRNF